MKRWTKVKKGTLIKLIDDLSDDPAYKNQLKFWENEDAHFLRDPDTHKIINVWIMQGEVCIVLDQDRFGLKILTPRKQVGWIGKERVEVIR